MIEFFENIFKNPFVISVMPFSVDLHQFYERVQELGGYQGCMSKKAWKGVYDDLGGNPQNTSAATCTRRHYERYNLRRTW